VVAVSLPIVTVLPLKSASRLPEVSAKVPFTVTSLVRVTFAAPVVLMVRLLTVAGRPLPVTWAAAPL
jgi:hypothetical protein